MTETYSGELSEHTKRALVWIFDAADGWQARTQEKRADDVQTGSSLLKDDEVTSPYLTSHAVRGALVSAVDHLDAFRALVQDAHVVHPRATLTLLRAAMENAALAVWLLAPASRNERVLRRLRLQWADFNDGHYVGRLFDDEPTPSLDDRRVKLQAIARKRGLTDDQIALVAARPVTFSSIVRTATRESRFLQLDERTAMFCWMATSGIAHARQWVVLSPALQRVEVPGAPEGSQGLLLSASEKMLTMAAGAATVMTAKGWRLLDDRRKCFLVRASWPEPAYRRLAGSFCSCQDVVIGRPRTNARITWLPCVTGGIPQTAAATRACMAPSGCPARSATRKTVRRSRRR